MENLILIGFMGAGKTSVGKACASCFHMDFLDTDEYIVRKAGMEITEIFRTKGEEAFRAMETEAVRDLIKEKGGRVISVGGGLPLREENRELLKKLGQVFYLQVSPKTVEERLRGDQTRPLLQGEDPVKRIGELLAYREPLYRKAAHSIVNVNNRSVADIVEEIGALAGQKMEMAKEP